MDILDHFICSTSDITSRDEELKRYDYLKKELQRIKQTEVKPQSFDPNACGLKKAKDLRNIFFFQSRKKKLQ